MPTSIKLSIFVAILTLFFIAIYRYMNDVSKNTVLLPTPTSVSIPSPTSEPLPTLPVSFYLKNDYHVFQTFNNCGPAAFSMALSYYGVNISQKELGEALRPYQNPRGDNDDKSVTLEELAEKAKEYNFIPYHRPAGDSEIIKQFIAHGMPVITRTLLKMGEDIGHYRVIKGYDDTTQDFIQDDSLQGKNLKYSYRAFDGLWQAFNYEYLVLASPDKKGIVERILGEYVDPKSAWDKAEANARQQLGDDPNNIYTRLNLSVALYHLGRYDEAIVEFEKVEHQLPFRTLWYQIEPIQAYYLTENYDRVFKMTQTIFDRYNRAFSELYLIRGDIYKKQGNIDMARAEYEKAVLYNKHLKKAQDALGSI